MTSVIFISLATVLYSAVHSLLATLTAKARARQLLGPVRERWYRFSYNVFAGISFIPIWALVRLLPDQPLYSIPFPWILISSIGQLAGIAIITLGVWQADAWAFLGFRQIRRPTEQDEKPNLVVNGLYRWMRHPLYTGGLIVLWLMPRMSINTLTLTIILSIYLVVGAIFEEKRLLHEFGEAYAEYQQRVPMLIPGLNRKG